MSVPILKAVVPTRAFDLAEEIAHHITKTILRTNGEIRPLRDISAVELEVEGLCESIQVDVGEFIHVEEVEGS